MTFQTSVASQPAPALDGDFASANPRGSMLAGPGTLVAGASLVVSRFAWARNDTGVANNAHPGVSSRLGFVHRDQIVFVGLTGAVLQTASLQVQPGAECTLFDSGDFWTRFAAGGAIGQKVFVYYADGTPVAAAAGSTIAGASVTAAAGGVFTATTATNTVLAVTAVTSGYLSIGDTVTGTGIPAGTTVTAQTSGTPGGIGNYTLSAATTASASGVTVTASSFNMIVSAVSSGTLAPGEPLSGTNVTAGTTLGAQSSGTAGGVGTYLLSAKQTFASTAVTALGAYESKWFIDSLAGANELAQISTRG